MDCVFDATSSWDLSELDDIMGKNPNMDVFSVADSTTMNNWSEQKHSMMSSSSSSSSKKPRVHVSEQHVSCLVDGCMADLSSCRDYHRRHRVCENHSKTPVVRIGGKEQRFCQQCSRFHSLGEFDEVKRSCRKRLDGHNRRRRKPRAESMYLNYGSFFTNHQGTKVLRFDGSPAYMTSFAGWPDKQNLNNQKLHVTVKDSPPAARFSSARERKFPFLLDNEYDKVNQPLTQVINTNASLAHLVVEPGAKGALSLLSKSTIHHHNHHASESGQTNLVQPFGTTLQFNGSFNQHLDPLRNVTGPNSDDHLIGMIHFQAQGLLENEAAQLLSFSWE